MHLLLLAGWNNHPILCTTYQLCLPELWDIEASAEQYYREHMASYPPTNTDTTSCTSTVGMGATYCIISEIEKNYKILFN